MILIFLLLIAAPGGPLLLVILAMTAVGVKTGGSRVGGPELCV